MFVIRCLCYYCYCCVVGKQSCGGGAGGQTGPGGEGEGGGAGERATGGM